MNKKIIANLKMNGSANEIEQLTRDFVDIVESGTTNSVIVAPPALYIPTIGHLLQNTSLATAGQTVSNFNNGAHTGEISASMLADVGCTYCIIGHSERRQAGFDTTDGLIAQCQRLIEQGITPIYCVGETQQQRQNGLSVAVIQQQLTDVLSEVANELSEIIIAYEPVWAIGTGDSASLPDIEAIHCEISKIISDQFSQINGRYSIVYGGSVKSANSNDILRLDSVDGVLIGSAALSAEQMRHIITSK